LEYWSSHYLGYTMSYTSTCPITYFTPKNVKNIQKMYIHTYKKISCKSFDCKKKSNSVRGRKKLSGKLKIYPPPLKNQMVRPLAKRICWGKLWFRWFRLCFHVTQSRNLAQFPSLTLTSYEIQRCKMASASVYLSIKQHDDFKSRWNPYGKIIEQFIYFVKFCLWDKNVTTRFSWLICK
jgi:hypothetical protein